MKAVGFYRNLPIEAPNALEDLELAAPVPIESGKVVLEG